jgi:hypothetical protein
MTYLRRLVAASAVALVYHPLFASACSVCMGDPNSKSAGAINAAIFLMLAFIGGVLALLVAFGLSLMRRANAPLPPHLEMAENQSMAFGAEEN